MTFNHEQTRERLVDFLSGELTADARAAFDAHVAACEACRAEVHSFQRARNLAREVVRAPLGDAVPGRVRARVLEAAGASAHRASSMASAPSAPSARVNLAEASARKPWFARWFQPRAARWTFPTFATVAAMAAFLLVRGTIFKEAKQPLGEVPRADFAPSQKPAVTESVNGPAGGSIPAPDHPSPAVARPEIAERADSEMKAKSGRLRAASNARAPARPAAASRQPASADRFVSPGAEAAGGKRDIQDDLVGGLSETKVAAKKAAPKEKASRGGSADMGAPASQARPAKGSLDDMLDGVGSGGGIKREAPAKPEARANRVQGLSHDADEGRAFAQPPAPVRRPTPSAEPLPASPAAEAEKSSEAPARGPRPAADKVSPTPAEPAPARAAKKSRTREAPEAVAAPAPQATSGAAASSPGDPVASQVERAERLMGARRWSEAAAAYRELLRRFPGHAQVGAWRKRLATADAAAAAEGAGFASPPPAR